MPSRTSARVQNVRKLFQRQGAPVSGQLQQFVGGEIGIVSFCRFDFVGGNLDFFVLEIHDVLSL